jgi:prepilin peptidase CpaA
MQSWSVFAGPAQSAVAGAAFVLLLGAVCVSDLRTRRIPNKLVLVIAVLGTLYSVAALPVLPGLAKALGGLAVGLALWFPFYVLRMLGAGDVKFFAAASTWIGASAALQAALLSALLGGALAILWLAGRAGWQLLGRQRAAHAARTQALGPTEPAAPAGGKLPYGVAMAAGLALVFWFPGFLRAA